jgi:FtsH-binding integral membrane protein
MREELLAHLTRLHEEELARRGDEAGATAAALERFGDAASLSRELQGSIPWIERWTCVPVLGWMQIRRRIGESAIQYILRMNAWVFVLSTGYYSLMMLVAAIARGGQHRVDQPTTMQLFILVAGLVVIQSVVLLGQGLFCEGIRQELGRRAAATEARQRRKANRRIVAYGAANSALVGAACAAMMFVANAASPISFITREGFWWITLGAVVLGVFFTLLQARSWNSSMRRFENWDSLEIEDLNPVTGA